MESKWKKYTGLVATPVTTRNQQEIEVFCPELLPFVTKTVDATAGDAHLVTRDATGDVTSHNFQVAETLTCTYLNLDTNEDVPDVVVGEIVWIYCYAGSTDVFFWQPYRNKQTLRLTEHVRFTVAARTADGELDYNNAYIVEIDSKYNPGIRIHTSKVNDEVTDYDINIDPIAGTMILKDGHENYIKIDTPTDTLTLESRLGGKLMLNEDLVVNAKEFRFNEALVFDDGKMNIAPTVTLQSPAKCAGLVTFLAGTKGDRT